MPYPPVACPSLNTPQAAKQPHADLSGAEVESSVRNVEHLLWLTQRSRAVLGSLSNAYRQLSAVQAALGSLATADSLPPQARCWVWYQQQRGALAALLQQAEETGELLSMAAAAETAAAPRKQLQAGAHQALAATTALHDSSRRLADASQTAVELPHSGSEDAQASLFLPAAMLAALRVNTAELQALQHQLESACAAAELPALPELAAAAAAAARESAAANASLHLGIAAAAPESQQQQLAEHLESAVAAALVWAQNARPAAPVAPDGEQAAPEQQLLPALQQQLEQHLCLPKAAELCSHAGAVLSAVAAASDLLPSAAAEQERQRLAAAAAGLTPLLGLLLGALRQLGLQYLALHKAVAKLCYITASLFAGLVQEGFCMPEATEGVCCGWEPLRARGAACRCCFRRLACCAVLM